MQLLTIFIFLFVFFFDLSTTLKQLWSMFKLQIKLMWEIRLCNVNEVVSQLIAARRPNLFQLKIIIFSPIDQQIKSTLNEVSFYVKILIFPCHKFKLSLITGIKTNSI